MAGTPDRTRTVIITVTAVIGLLIALTPLAYSVLSSSNPSPADTTSHAEGTAPHGSSVMNTDRAESAPNPDATVTTVSVERVVECPSPEEPGGAASTESELSGLRLPCLTAGGTESTSSLAQQWAGKPTVVNVWAWWCVPCREELPIVDRLAERNPQWNVVGVHLDSKAQAGADFLAETGVENLASYQDSSHQFDAATGIPKVVPVTLLYDENGQRAQIFVETFNNVEDMEQKIQEALQS